MSEENGHQTVEAETIVKDGETIVELRAVENDPAKGESTQREEDLWTPADTIEPPENLGALGRLTKASSNRAKCISALARNTVGLGWDVQAWPEHENEVDRERVKAARHCLDAFARRDKRLDSPSFTTLMEAVKHDLEEFGNGYLEVSRNRRTAKIDGLYHLPGQLVRRKRNRAGWVMGQNPDLVGADATRSDYYNFGEKVAYDANGVPQPRLADAATRWAWNEVVAFRHFTSESRDYGLPRDIDLALEYAAIKFVEEWTQSFFRGSGTPPTVLFIQGQEHKEGNRVRFTVNRQVMQRLDQALAADGPPGRKVVVVPVPPGTTVHAEQLSKLSDRDITFTEFRKEHRRNVGSSFGLMPIFYGDVEDAGRYTAEVQRSLTLEETFDPDQNYVEDKLFTTLMEDLGYSELRVVFKRLAVESDSAKRETANNGADRGAITVGEWRRANDYEPLPWDGDPADAANPNNQLFAVKGAPSGDPHQPVDQASQDERGLKPGIGGRGPARDAAVAKHDGPKHVEEVVDELAESLAEYGPVAGDA